MSLLSDAMETCTILNKQSVPDGYGGQRIVWSRGMSFIAAITFSTSVESKIGEALGVKSRYTVISQRGFNLEYHDVFTRDRDGKVFRVTEDSDDVIAPESASAQLRGLRQCSAEEWELPNG